METRIQDIEIPVGVSNCASMVRARVRQFHPLSRITSMCRVLWKYIMGRLLSPLPALCAFSPWMVGTNLGSRFVLRIWTDAVKEESEDESELKEHDSGGLCE
jgi:hypothetical protein